MNFKIEKLIVKGFKGYLNETEFTFGDKTEISANNGQGKTSIGEAISWVITGCDLFGNEKATTKLINNNKPKVTEVVIEYIQDNEKHTLIRRKKGSSNEIFLDDNKVKNNDISREIYQDKDTFLSIFNPYYFTSLTPKASKELLSSMLKPINRDRIFSELGDFLKTKLESNGFRNADTFLTDKREELKNNEENILYLEGFLDGKVKHEVPKLKVFNDKKIKELRNKIKDLQVTPINKNLNKLIDKLKDLKIKFNQTPTPLPLRNMSDLMAERNFLLNRYNKLKKQIDELKENIVECPNCKEKFDLNKFKVNEIKKELVTTIKEGKEKTKLIDSIENENSNITEKNKKTKLEYQAKIQEEIEIVQTEIKVIEKAIEDKENEKKLEVNKIKALIKEEEILEREVLTNNSNREIIEKQNKLLDEEIEKAKKEIKNSKNKISELKLVIDAAKQYNSIKLKKQTEIIKKYLNKVELQFERITKDGEIKDDFKILYEGREFNILSNAERIKAGLEIANFIMNMMNLHFPIFLDNAEAITEIEMLDTQMIMAKVTNNEMKVEVIK